MLAAKHEYLADDGLQGASKTTKLNESAVVAAGMWCPYP